MLVCKSYRCRDLSIDFIELFQVNRKHNQQPPKTDEMKRKHFLVFPNLLLAKCSTSHHSIEIVNGISSSNITYNWATYKIHEGIVIAYIENNVDT